MIHISKIVKENNRGILNSIGIIPPQAENFKPKSFAAMFKYFGDEVLSNIKDNKNFIIDDNNVEIIKQLYFYITQNESFDGDLNKGIWLYGNVGVGKTIIMLTYAKIFEHLFNRVIKTCYAMELEEIIKKFDYEFFKKRPILLDDVGREIKSLKIWGNESIPMVDIIMRREAYPGLTFATAQFDIKTICEKCKYGYYTYSRMKKIFNELHLCTGSDKRI